MHRHASRLTARAANACALAAPLLLTACGGGGGGTGELDVTFNYAPVQTTVLSANSETPTIQGLEGHSPSCQVTGGSLPKGMSIDGHSCALTGAPLESGTFDATVTLTASGASGSVTATVFMDVAAARVVYPDFPTGATWGFAQSFSPTINGYTPLAGDTVTYALASDQREDLDNMRSYFTLDPATGRFTGTFTGGPSHQLSSDIVNVVATIVRNGSAVTADGYLAVPFTTPGVYYQTTGFLKPGTPTTYQVTAPPFAALGYTVAYHVDSNTDGADATIDTSTGAVTINNDVNATFSVYWTATKGSQSLTGIATVAVQAG
jgi:hypothetical protein